MLFLLQEGPADTLSYMIAGYSVIFGVILVYLASLVVRRRNLQQDLELLEELDQAEAVKTGGEATRPEARVSPSKY